MGQKCCTPSEFDESAVSKREIRLVEADKKKLARLNLMGDSPPITSGKKTAKSTNESFKLE